MAEIIVYCTVSSQKEARKLADALVGEKFAACVSVVPSVRSTYWWKGKMERSNEALLIIKTHARKFNRLAERIKTLHSYTVPEILALPVKYGNAAYREWMRHSLKD